MKNILFVIILLVGMVLNPFKTFAGEWKETSKLSSKDNGRILEKKYFEGKKLGTDENGVQKIIELYNSEGVITERSYFGKNKKPTIHKKQGIHKEIFKVSNDFIKIDYFGVKGERLKDSEGCYNTWYMTDIKKNITSKICYPSLSDPYGKTIFWTDISNENISNDENLSVNCIRQDNNGVDGKPFKDNNGYYGYQLCYNKNNQISSIYFLSKIKDNGFSAYGPNEDGVAWYSYFYNKNILVSRYNYGSDLKPTEDKKGFHGYTSIIGEQKSDLWIHMMGYIGKDENKKNDQFGISQYFFRFKGNNLDSIICKDSNGIELTCPEKMIHFVY